jgi:hypothetical protein
MVSMDGLEIKRMFQLRVDMSAEMGNVVVRVLRNDEADKRALSDANVHYVMHMWAVRSLIPCFLHPHNLKTCIYKSAKNKTIIFYDSKDVVLAEIHSNCSRKRLWKTRRI